MKNKIHVPENKKDLIMIDCFGVVSSPIINRWLIEMFGEEEGKRIDEEYSYLGDTGQITLYEYADYVAKRLNLNTDELYKDWISDAHINYELLDYIQELRKNNMVVLASNCSPSLVEDVFKYNNVKEDVFDYLFKSYEFHLVKPSLDFYKYILDSFDKKFDHIYMVDDRDINLKEVHELGIIPVQFINNKKLKEDLNK